MSGPELARWALLFFAALGGGAMNAVAGGGSLPSFGALVATGVAPVTANATTTIALLPGAMSSFWAYRKELRAREPLLPLLIVAGLGGGLLGAWLLLRAGDSLFARLVPWLVGGATALFALQGRVRRFAVEREGKPARSHLFALFTFQLVVSTYGGFFGAGMGIVMLGAFALLGVRPIHRMNALKNLAATATNGVAAVYFIVEKRVDWRVAPVMAAGAIVGGYAGARLARRSSGKAVERIVVVIGLGLTGYLAWRALGH